MSEEITKVGEIDESDFYKIYSAKDSLLLNHLVKSTLIQLMQKQQILHT